MRNRFPFPYPKGQGSALIVMLILLGLAVALLVSALKSNPQIERDKITADAMAKAKDALIGYAATYRESHPSAGPIYDKVFGYLPCPDTDNNGEAESDCGSPDVSLIGRLPWKTLGLPPLRDGSGECLWYAVSGRYKNNQKTTALNWDTTGQFVIQDAASTVLANGAVAVVFAARSANSGQTRTSGTNDCSGDSTNNVNAYLEGSDAIYAGTLPAPNASSTLTMSTVASIASGTNNDQGLWIAPNEIWDRVKKRSDFVTDITNLLNDVKVQAAMDASCTATTTLDPPVPGSIVEAGVSGKTVGMAPTIQQICIMTNAVQRMAVFENWRNNLLYATCPGGTACLTVNGSANCAGAVIFSGERVSGRTRPSNAAIDYLEGDNLSAFTSAATLISGVAPYAWNASSQDIAVCIPPVGGGTWPFEYPTQWAGVPSLDAANVAVGGGTNTNGTSGNDDVSITGDLSSSVNLKSGNDELLVTGDFTSSGNFGAGDDVVKIVGNTTGSIDMGSGNDYLDIGGNSQGSIDAGQGDDKILIGGNATASLSLDSGNDELHIKGSASSSIDAGSGDNKIRIDGSMSSSIQLGNGDDYVLIFGNAANIDAGSGSDIILIGGNATAGLDLGAGNDYLEILGNSAGLDAGGDNDIVKITGSASNAINLGAGNDILVIGGTFTWISGGGGNDKIYLKSYTMANCATLLASNIASDVESVKVSNGMCRGSDFTVP